MVSGYDLRINLSYFIGKSYEKEIMNKINEISKKYPGFDVRLFYSEQDNLVSKLKDFAKRYDGNVNFSIRIASTDYQQINDVCWYQILSEKDLCLIQVAHLFPRFHQIYYLLLWLNNQK